jgi:BNR repeat-like domain
MRQKITALGVTALVVVLALVSPVAASDDPTSLVISRGEAAGPYQAFPDVCRLPGGDLACVFYAGYGHVSLPNDQWPRGGRICLVRSSDEGRTWSEPRVLFDGPQDDRDPHVAAMQDGTLWCSFFQYRSRDGRIEHDVCLVASRDGGRTWDSEPRVLAADKWAVSAPVRELPDGTRILGVYTADAKTAYGAVLRSTDKGNTWSGPVAIDPASGVRLDAETDVILLKDGRLFAALRGDGKVNMHYSTSADLGLTWSGVKDIGFRGHCPHLTRLAGGEILLVHRVPATSLHISRDDAKTWQGPIEIDSVGGAYPSTVELKDGTVLVVYYEEGPKSAIRARRFRVTADGVEMLGLARTAGAAAGCAQATPPVDLGTRWELFVDNFLIDASSGVSLKLNAPERREVVLATDAPWEGPESAYFSVVQDGDLVRLYYRGFASGADTSAEQVTCVAESRDGIHFTRPKLGIVPLNGSAENNVIWRGIESHNFAPFLDKNPACKPLERYKALAGVQAEGKNWQEDKVPAGLYAFASPDGIHWHKISNQPVMTKGAFDSLNLAFWDAVRGRYACYSRIFADRVRAIQSSHSSDFLTWSDGVPNRYAEGAPREHFYTNATVPCPGAEHLLLSFPKRFVPERKKIAEHTDVGVSDAVFLSSRDGLNWDRTFLEAWVRPGRDQRNWTDRNNMPAWGIAETAPGEWSMYASEHYRWPDNRLRRLVLARHRIASASAGANGGEFTTRPVTFAGNRLVLNYATSAAGSVQVELQDAEGKPIPGFALADMPPLFGDELDAVVAWKSGADLSSLAGKPVRLRFALKDADVYALRFQNVSAPK